MFVENSSYYMLGYRTAHPELDGKYRRLSVKVAGYGDLTVHARNMWYRPKVAPAAKPADGGTTIMPVTLTTSQRQLVVALAEHVLAQPSAGRASVPTSAEAAARLGWSMTTFNRKLDNVCEKLDKIGVDGLRGGRGRLATNRRARLVEYAVATRLVSVDDLALLDRGADGEAEQARA